MNNMVFLIFLHSLFKKKKYLLPHIIIIYNKKYLFYLKSNLQTYMLYTYIRRYNHSNYRKSLIDEY